jgi:hypothetical protein
MTKVFEIVGDVSRFGVRAVADAFRRPFEGDQLRIQLAEVGARSLAAHRVGEDLIAAAREELGEMKVDYLAVTEFNGRRTLVVAVRVGAVRLIDNVRFDDVSTTSDAVKGVSAGETIRA